MFNDAMALMRRKAFLSLLVILCIWDIFATCHVNSETTYTNRLCGHNNGNICIFRLSVLISRIDPFGTISCSSLILCTEVPCVLDVQLLSLTHSYSQY
ncbi:hypothetical protein BO85DRAFT_142966 [Aspergillus piperis CBS 112811]|uniref:Secreted protein n=1 Tax=Aspergillus piperis CBS 112811 TaxID=1448313 RepID=A0A8G1VIF4_9EURO|nr:hypothetical protein BO85DRAFT_142966 [Aspergillus piperis CBS 112811]RAH54306.1 hypothetical protein BO85DRAFT_142966 [Aspergillus piperis CBS 112811]